MIRLVYAALGGAGLASLAVGLVAYWRVPKTTLEEAPKPRHEDSEMHVRTVEKQKRLKAKAFKVVLRYEERDPPAK